MLVLSKLFNFSSRRQIVVSQAGVDTSPPSGWMKRFRPGIQFCPESETIPEAFLTCCDRMGDSVAVADERMGILTYKRLKISVLAAAGRIKKLPGKNIGIMLPASVGAVILTYATLLAGKVPVMINWTAGPKNLKHAVDLSKLEVVLTSRVFLEKLKAPLGPAVKEKLLAVEDLKKQIGPWRKLFAYLLAQMSPEKILRYFNWKGDSNSTAVILFTSGSEASPKGVPLTHRNILSNVSGIMQRVSMVGCDILLGFLPPFHSFGFTANVVLPTVLGLKTVYHPDPTRGRQSARVFRKWRVSVCVGPPTFLLKMLSVTDPSAFKTGRLFLSGAEPTPQALIDQVSSLGAELRVGFGTTECGPTITITTYDKTATKNGVGKPVQDMQVMIVCPDTLRALPDGERGLIITRGPNVFPGYMGNEARNPFVTIKGARWYNTGDLGTINDESLDISGRLSRFVKISGEKIGLQQIETALSDCWPPGEDGPRIAVTAKEGEAGARRTVICLFTTIDISREKANAALKKSGLSGLSKIHRVRKVKAIPVLGSGKVNYPGLRL